MCSDKMKSLIQTSAQELAYRTKHYHDIQIIKGREPKCCSCGNLVSIERDRITSHSVLGTLQCMVCHNRWKELDFTKERVIQEHCACCGYSAALYPCSNNNCSYSFCRKCIKRNASLVLLNAETGQWKCFICEPKPLWELRGLCAAIMLPHSRRMKNASTHSSYAKSRLTKTKNVKRSLRGLCDDDMSPVDTEEDLRVTYISSDSDDNEGVYNASVSRRKSTALKLNRSETSSRKLSKRNEASKESKSRQFAKNRLNSDEATESKADKLISATSSDSEDEGVMSKVKVVNRGKAEKHQQIDFDSDSSSKEFQTSKKIINKAKQIDKNVSEASTSISKEQNVRFKLRVVKTLNRFKELCSEYELHMEHFKLKHFRKEVSDVQSAQHIVHKLFLIIRKMTTSLIEQENKLNQFFETFKEELKTRKAESNSEVSSANEEEVVLQEKGKVNETNERLADDEPLNDANSSEKSKDKKKLQNEDRASKTSTKKQKSIFLSSDSEDEKDKPLKEDARAKSKKETKAAETENLNQSSKKPKNPKQAEEQPVASKVSDNTHPGKDKDELAAVDSDASGYDVEEIFSDEDLHVERPKKTGPTKKALNEAPTENDESGDPEEKSAKKKKQTEKADLAEDVNLNESTSEKNKKNTEQIMNKKNVEETTNINQQEEQEKLEGSEESTEKNTAVAKELSRENDISEKSGQDENEKQMSSADETSLKDKNTPVHSETDVSIKRGENDSSKTTETKETTEKENLSTENPRSPVLKLRNTGELLSQSALNESVDDIFAAMPEYDESDMSLSKYFYQSEPSKDISVNNKDMHKENEAETENASAADKSKQGSSMQAKTKPTESAKRKVLSAGTSEESTENTRGEVDSEEERARKIRLILEDLESEDIDTENASEKLPDVDKRTEKENSDGIDATEPEKGDNNSLGAQFEKLAEAVDNGGKEAENSNDENIERPIEKDKSILPSEAAEEEGQGSKTPDEDTDNNETSGNHDYEIASDTTEILVLDSSYEREDQNKTPIIPAEAIKKEITRKDSLDEEEKAKRALLDSDDSTSTKISKSESSSKRSRKRLRNSSWSTESSDCESNTSKRRLRKAKIERRDSMNTRTKRRRYQINVDKFQDPKLEMGCAVVIRRMSGELLEKYEKALTRSKLRLDRKAIKNLIDLEKLGRDHKRETWNATDSWIQLKGSHKKGKAKKTKNTLMDHLDLNKTENNERSDSEGKNVSDSDEKNSDTAKSDSQLQTNEELKREADMAKKMLLLHSSDSDIDIVTVNANSDETNSEKTEKEESSRKAEKKKAQSDKKSSDESDKSKWRRCKVLTCRLSDLDETDEVKQWKMKKEKLDADDAEKKEEGDGERQVISRKRRPRRRIIDSDSNAESPSENVDSDYEEQAKSSGDSDASPRKSKKKRTRSSDTDSSLEEKKPKPKRKRIKKVASDSDSDNDKIPNSQDNASGKGRKNIRKVMKDKQVAEDTKQAAKEEEERLKRIAERQRIYNEMYEARLAGEKKVEKLVLDFNPETKEEIVTVDDNLVKRLKPHQADGIKFMWDACFESIERIKTTPGSGCILAHCMGLGKSLQVVALVHTLLSHEDTGVNTVLIVCPLSTVLNWMNEFEIWLKDVENCDDINVYEITRLKKNFERKCQLEHWHRTTGVMIVSYNMFRNLTGARKMGKKMKESLLKSLIDPGPDLVICDEGHLLKNEGTATSKCMQMIKTLRRIVLTGTPLQNNLTEYHCMVQFVKPNLLGTKREFLNRFVNPITNGQFDDSTEYDVKLMKKRAYVLHKMLEGCVQRFDYSVLMPFLPPKQEYVIFVALADVQIKMYKHYLENFARTRAVGGLFADFQALQRIWTHPIVLQLNSVKVNERRRYSSDSEGSIKDFIKDSTSESESDNSSVLNDNSSDDDEVQTIHDTRDQNAETSKSADAADGAKGDAENTEDKEESDKEEKEWWMEYAQPEHFEDMRTSAKLVLLFGILKECEEIGDKVLVFSQSLYSLTLIEQFLERIHDHTQKGTTSENLLGHTGSWTLGLDYFRLDGQTSAENRRAWCRIFNRPDNTRARLFLISTRAGGLGINLTAANRVIIFDASWNPSHDVQSIFRIYRFGQKKPCYVYRFLAFGTMEEKIYNRQVTKLSLSCRVIDEQQIERHYSNHNLNELYKLELSPPGQKQTLALPKDRLLAEIFLKYKDFVENYHEHDSLLENKVEEELDEEERKLAWLEYEEEKKGKIPQSYMPISMHPGHMVPNQFDMPTSSTGTMHIDYESLQQLISKDYPNATPEQQIAMTKRAVQEMYNYWERQAMLRPNMVMAQNPTVGNAPRHRAVILNPVMTPTTTVPQITQVHSASNMNPSLVMNPYVYRTVEANPSTAPDDDIVEIPPTPVLPQTHHSNNKNKEQEE